MGDMNLAMVQRLKSSLEGGGASTFAVHEEHLALGTTGAAEVVNELAMVRMAGERIQCVHFGANRVQITEDADLERAVHDAATQRIGSAIAHEEHGIVITADAILQVVQNAPCLAHAGSGNDDCLFAHIIEAL